MVETAEPKYLHRFKWLEDDEIVEIPLEYNWRRMAPSVEQAQAAEIDNLARVTQGLVAPLFVPRHEQVGTVGPKIVEVRLVVEEKAMVIDEDGTVVQAMTFNGSVPGPLIVVHESHYVELTLVNPEANILEHSIDFHASTGALGGAALTHVFPGEEVVIRWKATKAGVFVYHCAPGTPWAACAIGTPCAANRAARSTPRAFPSCGRPPLRGGGISGSTCCHS